MSMPKGYKPTPWGEINVSNALQLADQARDSLENSALHLQSLTNGNKMLEEVLDLYPETLRRIEHIKEDLEDILAGRTEFRHESGLRQFVGGPD